MIDAPAQASVEAADTLLVKLDDVRISIWKSYGHLASREVALLNEVYDAIAVDRALAALSPPPTVGAEDEAQRKIAELEPFRDELLKIAERVGERDDPFAAWEAFEALLTTRPSPSAVEVKGLEWVKDGPHWTAHGAFGQGYQIYESSADAVYRVMFSWSTKMWDLQAPTLDEAKAAAQADYEHRIRSCIASEKGG